MMEFILFLDFIPVICVHKFLDDVDIPVASWVPTKPPCLLDLSQHGLLPPRPENHSGDYLKSGEQPEKEKTKSHRFTNLSILDEQAFFVEAMVASHILRKHIDSKIEPWRTLQF